MQPQLRQTPPASARSTRATLRQLRGRMAATYPPGPLPTISMSYFMVFSVFFGYFSDIFRICRFSRFPGFFQIFRFIKCPRRPPGHGPGGASLTSICGRAALRRCRRPRHVPLLVVARELDLVGGSGVPFPLSTKWAAEPSPSRTTARRRARS